MLNLWNKDAAGTASASRSGSTMGKFTLLVHALQVLVGASVVLGRPLTYKQSDLIPNRGCATVVTERDRVEMDDALNEMRSMTPMVWDMLEARDGAATANATAALAVNGTAVNTTTTLWNGQPLPQIAFDVYWHVLYANETIEGGYVSDKQIMDQMDVMNRDYKSANISWNFMNITRIDSADWFVNSSSGSPQEADMKRTYHKGSSRVLNIFTAGFNATDKSLGYSTLPSSYFREPLKDGLIIRYTTLPGGSHTNYNLGRTTVHELGHWLGLYHTFEGGCSGIGDNVADTAPESSGAEGCPIGRKSCPDSKDPDPIHNFMDYSFDACMTHFTPGQAVRMHEAIWAFRTPRTPVASNATSIRVGASANSTSTSTTTLPASAATPALATGVDIPPSSSAGATDGDALVGQEAPFSTTDSGEVDETDE